MKTLLLALALVGSAMAQVYPTGVATDSDLPRGANSSSTTLSTSINDTDTSIVLVSGTTFVSNQVITIGTERIKCGSLSTNTFSGCVRGYDGSSAASHSAGAAVYGYLVAAQINNALDEIKAIEGALGANLGNVVQQGALNTLFTFVDAGANDTYVVSTPVVGSCFAAYSTGLSVLFMPNTNNTGAAALNACAKGSLAIKKADGTTDPSDNDLKAGRLYLLQYVDAATDYWRMQDQPTGGASFPVTSNVIKGDGAGGGAAATPGTDYVIPGGNVATATALAANPANCGAGNLPRGVDASGVGEGCAAVNLATEVTGTLPGANQGAMVGDSGSGGTKGAVPAPASGDAAAGKYLKADGTWGVPPGAGGGGIISALSGTGNPNTGPTSCTAPSISGITYFIQTDSSPANALWRCYDTNSWALLVEAGGSGPIFITGEYDTTISAPGTAGQSTMKFLGAKLGYAPNGGTVSYTRTDAEMAAKAPVASATRVCDMAIGDTSGSAITNSQLGPQKRVCFITSASTVLEVNVAADGGTPNVIVGRNRAGTTANLVSAALATAASGGIACSKTSAVTCIDGATTASATLQNTSLNAGDYIELVSGTAGGVAKFMTVHVVYSVN